MSRAREKRHCGKRQGDPEDSADVYVPGAARRLPQAGAGYLTTSNGAGA